MPAGAGAEVGPEVGAAVGEAIVEFASSIGSGFLRCYSDRKPLHGGLVVLSIVTEMELNGEWIGKCIIYNDLCLGHERQMRLPVLHNLLSFFG